MEYAAVQERIFQLKGRFPLLQTAVIGQSLLGRSLYGLTVGGGENHILLAGAFHGMEHITADLLLAYLESLCQDPPPGRVTVVPLVNPDGVEIQQHGWQRAGRYRSTVKAVSGGDTSRWQANGRGVDLNHNFAADWQNLRKREQASGITGPAATRFGGYYPESEPESHALCQLCRRERFSLAVALHTQGEEIYYDFGKDTPCQSLAIAQAMAEVSGYQVAKPEGLAVGGGFKDWFLTAFRRPAFTIEAGKGENPLPNSDLPAIYEKLRPMLDRLIRR